MLIAPHLQGFYALMGSHTASLAPIPQHNVSAFIELITFEMIVLPLFSCSTVRECFRKRIPDE
jgi:hypothetical protein